MTVLLKELLKEPTPATVRLKKPVLLKRPLLLKEPVLLKRPVTVA
ncbi:hypothetical protein [Streptomyces sp. NPDC058011]